VGEIGAKLRIMPIDSIYRIALHVTPPPGGVSNEVARPLHVPFARHTKTTRHTAEIA